ncbi:4-methylaminobutanoate oxidase (formaldehyde-forming) [Micromonospora kangleipakensis]|uniref:4-methylaminobutanoate oxidase (Formaldehyde-forming) n=1 Tax=Micromonospora kangleipakensis TaxID=1077942 RepID=A0A4Q8B943_9ACTN|nr:FAD-dependent oxidoreductase [Micromonospora kangleipakensis]RZU73998.1 4-methylaminobutanoate oxidase (formaldehyde-forming) [Micromonospora kangleipakensis]
MTLPTPPKSGPAPSGVPDRARVVVVGGGIIGTSVAYHLAHLGWTDVVLLERDQLTSGTTWHAAGLMVTFGSTSETSTEMRRYTRDLYARLEAETGLATGLKQVGFIELATEPGRLEEYRRVSAFNRYCGVDVHEISPGEVKKLFPLARTDDLLAGFYVPQDGRANPVDVTMSLAKGARMKGVKILEGVPATGVLRRGGAVTGVRTPYGDIEAEYVVNCAGMWARQLGAAAGVNIPLQAAEHYYLITEPVEGVDGSLPVLEDPASYGYFREEGGGLMLGLFETVCAPWKIEGIPDNFSFGELPPDWDRMAPYLEKAMERIPVSMEVGVRKFFCGPESFTPDLQPIVGEAPELKNYFVAAGLNSIGILTGGGIGRALAHWIVDGRPDIDVTGINIDRLHAYQSNPEYRATRTVESLGMVYQCHYPGRSMQTARNAKLSPLHHRLVEQRAYFKDVSGWEGADWYAPEGVEPKVDALSWGRQNWFPYWEAEHRAAREGVILMDMSFMSKFLVQGRDAGRELERISANRVDGEAGVITYTQWLNEGGTLEADLTVTKLGDDRFWVVASDTAHRHVEARMRRHFGDAHAFVTDVSGGYAQINIQGPRSRELLASVTTQDMSNEAFPFRTAREIDLGFARVLCIRITYLGELGYELYIPAEQAVHVYDRLVEAGRAVGLRHAGLKALSSLRMEKGYRDYGHDIDNTDSVLEAGLGFAVALDKPGGFIGREAVLAKKAEGPLTRRLVQVLVTDPEPLMFHAEVVRRNGTPVGYIRAASYGFSLGGAVGLAMVDARQPLDQAWIDSGKWTVEIGASTYPAVVSLRPLYDPANKRIKM